MNCSVAQKSELRLGAEPDLTRSLKVYDVVRVRNRGGFNLRLHAFKQREARRRIFHRFAEKLAQDSEADNFGRLGVVVDQWPILRACFAETATMAATAEESTSGAAA